MANQKDLQTAVDALTTKITGLGSELTDFAGDFSAAIDALKAQIGSGAGGPDLQPQVDALTALSTQLDTIAASLAGLDTTAEGISGVPTTPAA